VTLKQILLLPDVKRILDHTELLGLTRHPSDIPLLKGLQEYLNYK